MKKNGIWILGLVRVSSGGGIQGLAEGKYQLNT